MGANQGRAKGNKQRAEYGNLEGKHERSGWRERGKRRSESGSAHRDNHCEVKPGRAERKNSRLSSQNRKRSRRKKADRKGKARKRSGREEAEKKGSTGGTAVGAKPGRAKGNEQKAEYLELEGRHERSGRREREKRGSESGT